MSDIVPTSVVALCVLRDYNAETDGWAQSCRSPFGDRLSICPIHQDSGSDPPIWAVWRGGRCYDTCDIQKGFEGYVLSEVVTTDLLSLITEVNKMNLTLEDTLSNFHRTAKSIEATRVKIDDDTDPIAVACKEAIQTAEKDVEKHAKLIASLPDASVEGMEHRRYNTSLERLARTRFLIERLTSGRAVPEEVIQRLEGHQRTLDDTIRTIRNNIKTLLSRLVIMYYGFLTANPANVSIAKITALLAKHEGLLAPSSYGAIVERYVQSKRSVATAIKSKKAPVIIRRDGTVSADAPATPAISEALQPILDLAILKSNSVTSVSPVTPKPEPKRCHDHPSRRPPTLPTTPVVAATTAVKPAGKRWAPRLPVAK